MLVFLISAFLYILILLIGPFLYFSIFVSVFLYLLYFVNANGNSSLYGILYCTVLALCQRYGKVWYGGYGNVCCICMMKHSEVWSLWWVVGTAMCAGGG